MRVLRVIFAGLCLVVPLQAAASTDARVTGREVSNAIVSALSDAGIEAKPTINANRLFRKCSSDLQVEKAFGGWQTVRVYCPQENDWDIFVRTGHQKKKMKKNADVIEKREKLEKSNNLDLMQRVIAIRPIKKGDFLTRNDLGLQTLSRASSGGYTDMDALVGRRIKRPVRAGLVIKDRHLYPDWMVQSKQLVSIVNNAGGIEVTMSGIALENGRFGDLIKVRNLTSDNILHGFVAGSKKISVGPKIN
ncbi:MAG: Uncharacterised protein [Rhodobiaceae bacterium UBA7378]|nr:MAG: Uncharacterised protein [Rhodobiaceae bacterium UBA7378]